MSYNTNQIKKTAHRSDFNPGPFIAEVVDHRDSDKMGTLKVQILSGTAGAGYADAAGFSYVDYCPPFYGTTPYAAMDANARASSSTQQSYGFWMVPPDIGTKVLVMFVESDDNRGYWLGCIPEKYMNHMVPGIAANQYTELTPQEKQKLGYDENAGVPVAEINRRLTDKTGTIDTDKIKKPLHPFALRLAEQGLLKDPIRGTSTSSARRASISNVYGISTPGPPVLKKTYNMGSRADPTAVYTEREGGTQFVMDDGKISQDEKTGKRGITDELVRIRTRTGHQILLHNSSDLIYICNSKGTAWMEFTSNGKIDIFAQDSVSIHSENDFNFRADRDINMEAGRNINMSSVNSTHFEAGSWIEGVAALEVNWSAVKHVNINAGGKIRLTSMVNATNPVSSGIDLYALSGNLNVFSLRDVKIQTPAGMSLKSGVGLNVISGAGTTIQSGGEMNINSIGSNFITSKISNVFSATTSHIERAGLIDMNGPTVAPVSATAATNLATALDALTLMPESATSVEFLDTNNLPSRGRDTNATAEMQKGWESNNYYRQPDISSITKRVPMHEPWDHHENIDPNQFTPTKTDRGG